MNDEELKSALVAHKREIEELAAQMSAATAVLMGVMLRLAQRGMRDVGEEAIEYAAMVTMATAEENPGVLQTSRSLQIVDELRDAFAAAH